MGEEIQGREEVRYNGHYIKRPQPVTIAGYVDVEDIFSLPKIGAGHDGLVFRYGKYALKYLKYDIPTRKEKNLMTFEKARLFRDSLDPEVLLNPIMLLQDTDGQYCGYGMQYVENLADPKNPNYKAPSTFSTEYLFNSIEGLERDEKDLSRENIIMKDINRGSYIFSSELMRICDMDKFYKAIATRGAHERNKQTINYIIAKLLYYQLKDDISPERLKVLNEWVKRSILNRSFLDSTKRELEAMPECTIGDYLETVKRKI